MENAQYEEVNFLKKSQDIPFDTFDDVQGIFGGYVVRYENKDRQGDIIKRRAFAEDIQKFYSNEKTINVCHEHDLHVVLSAEPIEIKDDANGVYGTFQVSQRAKEIHKNIWNELPRLYKNGKLGFSVGIQKAMTTKLDGGRFIIHKAIMKEFSTTASPANLEARADIMKSMEEFENLLKNVSSFSRAEEFLRKNSNLSQKQCGDFLRKFHHIAIEKASILSPAEDCQLTEPAEVQNKDAFTSEIEKLFNKTK